VRRFLQLGLLALAGCTTVATLPEEEQDLEAYITGTGRLRPVRMTAPSVEAADLIVLGGRHLDAEVRGGAPDTLAMPFRLSRLLREGDTLLAEMSRDLVAPYETLVRGKLITVRAIDCDRELKVQHLGATIQGVVLATAARRLERGEALHPFETWLLCDDLGVVDPEQPAAEMVAAIRAEERRQTGAEGVAAQRHRAIVHNVVAAATDPDRQGRQVLVIGAAHVTGFDGTLLAALEAAGVDHAAFATPDPEPAPATTAPPATPRPRTPAEEYFEDRLLPRYVQEREALGRPPYEGSYQGLLAP
jgi:hypothetical protein